jgi:hypothetical protein
MLEIRLLHGLEAHPPAKRRRGGHAQPHAASALAATLGRALLLLPMRLLGVEVLQAAVPSVALEIAAALALLVRVVPVAHRSPLLVLLMLMRHQLMLVSKVPISSAPPLGSVVAWATFIHTLAGHVPVVRLPLPVSVLLRRGDHGASAAV